MINFLPVYVSSKKSDKKYLFSYCPDVLITTFSIKRANMSSVSDFYRDQICWANSQ